METGLITEQGGITRLELTGEMSTGERLSSATERKDERMRGGARGIIPGKMTEWRRREVRKLQEWPTDAVD